MATRLEIRDRAKVRADMDTSDFPTDVQWNAIIDEVARTVWAKMVIAGLPSARVSQDITATGASSYTLAPVYSVGIIQVPSVYRKTSTAGASVRLSRINEEERASFLSATGFVPYGEKYDIELDPSTGWVFKLYPSITKGGVYTVEFIPNFSGFSADSTIWWGPYPSDELVVLLSAMKAKRKEEPEGGQRLYQEAKEVWTDLFDVISGLAAPVRIQDTISLAQPRRLGDWEV